MDSEEFDYDLPEELIAQEPLPSRSDSRMMVVERKTGSIRHGRFRDIADYLNPGHALVIDDSRVIPARLLGRDRKGRAVEVLLVSEMKDGLWVSMVKPSKRVAAGLVIDIAPGEFEVEVVEELEEGKRVVRLKTNGALPGLLDRFGHVPLPPYIRRADLPSDRERYQTVYARQPGSVAAPTAGLHFDDATLSGLKSKGVGVVPVMLHVGPGTFRPVREREIERHRMDAERYEMAAESADVLNAARAGGREIVAVGTTATRVLETVVNGDGRFGEAQGWTDLFIFPPYTFKAVDRLITNFHLPRATLLMLVAAFAGRELTLAAYRTAIEERYRFYSYGDVMLIL